MYADLQHSGRLIAQSFLTLPSKQSLPTYYKKTRMPIALDTVENKLKRREFSDLASLEGYLKRMCQNGKEYYDKGTTEADDSERIRKCVSNFMVKNNPAYKIKGYTAVATPYSDEEDREDTGMEDAEGESEEEEPAPKAKGRSKIILNTRTSATPALPEKESMKDGYDGLNLQQAQEKIMEDLLTGPFEEFYDLPPRSLKDYYKAVRNPISLTGLQKRVKGVGKKAELGVSEFKSWTAFEEEASNLWKNAYFYNEDGSEIFVRAQALEVSSINSLI